MGMKHAYNNKFDAASEAKRVTAHYDDASDIMGNITSIIILHNLNSGTITLLIGYIMYYLDDDIGFDLLQLLEKNSTQ
tara:strand:+ start:64 stop:297 length:234 start_codon:yes stop_codon:yes gene_type:complete